MKFKSLHRWDLSPKEAVALQRKLADKLFFPKKNINLEQIKTIAGVDVSFQENESCASICILSFPDFKLLEHKTFIMKAIFPYIPGLLSFREGPVVLECFKGIKTIPDVILFDAQGIAHPRRLGLASHMGLWIDVPSVGCAKTPLFGKFKMPDKKKGSSSYIIDKEETIGAAVRTRDNTKPIYVSPGNNINLASSRDIALTSCIKYKIPEPLRQAHSECKSTLKEFLK